MAKDSTAAARSQRVTKKAAASGKVVKNGAGGERSTDPKAGKDAPPSSVRGTSQRSASAATVLSGGFARRTVTLPPDLVAQIDRIVGRGEFSAFMAEAARRQVARDNLGAFLDEIGPVSDAARSGADQALAEAFARMNARVSEAAAIAVAPAAAQADETVRRAVAPAAKRVTRAVKAAAAAGSTTRKRAKAS